jgi:hypothetical protein
LPQVAVASLGSVSGKHQGYGSVSVIVKGKNPRKPHTVRFWVDGRQRERSFATATDIDDVRDVISPTFPVDWG